MKIALNKLTLYALYLYIATLFVLAYDPTLNLISKGMFLILCASLFFDIIKSGEMQKATGVYIYTVFFGLFALASCFWSPDFDYSFSRTITFMQILVLFVVILNTVRTKDEFSQFLSAIFWSIIIMCAYTVIYYGPSYIMECLSEGIRIGGEINQENAFGLYCSVGAILGFYKAIYQKKKWYFLIALLPFVLAFGSGSRKTILVIIAGTAMLLALKAKKINFFKIALSFAVIIALFLILYNMESLKPLFGRFELLLNIFSDGEADGSAVTRLNMISFGWEMFKKKPFFGYGIEAYNILYLQNFGMERPSHCNYIQILVSFGTTGFLLYYGIYIYILSKSIKNLKGENKDLAAIVIVLCTISLVSDITTTSLLNKFSFILISAGMTFTCVVRDIKDR